MNVTFDELKKLNDLGVICIINNGVITDIDLERDSDARRES